MANPMLCDRCGAELEPDDAISILDGVCLACRYRADTGQPLPRPRKAAEAPPVPAQPSAHLIFEDAAAEPGDHHTRLLELVNASDLAHFDPPPRVRRRRRDLAVGMFVGLLLTAAIGWYVVTQSGAGDGTQVIAETITIPLRVSPPTATVRVNGAEIGPAEFDGYLCVSLPADSTAVHWLEVSADGYTPVRQTLPAAGRAIQQIDINLVAKPFDLIVKTEPPGAEVWLGESPADGNGASTPQLRGYAPLTLSLPPDTSGSIAVRHPGHHEVIRQLTPPAPGETAVIDVALRRTGPIIQVESQPPGATVSIDGVEHGPSPVQVELDPRYFGRTVSLSASLAGHDDAATQITIASEPVEPARLRMTLARSGIKLRIATQPAGGYVIVDGKSAGRTPMTLTMNPADAGRSIPIQAVGAPGWTGAKSVRLPERGSPVDVTVPLELRGSQVVFAMICREEMRSEFSALSDRMIELVSQTAIPQELTILSMTNGGIAAWPAEGETLPASGEQKVRAYDHIRSLRLGHPGDAAQIVQEALSLKPAAIWLFASSEAELESLKSIELLSALRHVSISVATTARATARPWLRDWTARHGGAIEWIGEPDRTIADRSANSETEIPQME
jgi:hypothetical protein